MKKVFSLLVALALVVTLAACTPETVYIEKEVPVEVQVPVEVEVQVPVEVPVEVIKIVPEIVTETEYVTEYVDVPAQVDSERYYKPGVYMAQTEMSSDGEYTFAVVIVDSYGQLAGVAFDTTQTESTFKYDADENLYIYIAGDKAAVPNTWRLVTGTTYAGYPKFSDAITADDLVEGINNAEIAALMSIDTFETTRVIAEGVSTTSTTAPATALAAAKWVAQTDALATKIKADQTTYGIQTLDTAGVVTATNVTGVTTLAGVDVLLALVQGILDDAAALTDDTVLVAAADAINGLYDAGEVNVEVTGRAIDLVAGTITHNMAVVAIDAYGVIAGVWADQTMGGATAAEKSTQWIQDTDYAAQAMTFANVVVANQGTAAITSNDADDDGHYTLKNVEGVTIEASELNASVSTAVAAAKSYSLQDGTYRVFDEETGLILFVTIGSTAPTADTTDNGYIVVGQDTAVTHKIQSLFIDNIKPVAQATYSDADGVQLPLFTYEQQWLSGVDVETRDILVYQDGASYYAARDYDADGGAALEEGDTIRFALETTDGIDEEATLAIVAGNQSKRMRDGDYGAGVFTSDWSVQADEWQAEFYGSDSPYILNMAADGSHQDTLTGVTLKVDDWQQALVDALLLSVAAYEAENDTSSATAASDYQYLAPMTAVDLTSVGVYGNGQYFIASDPNEAGDQFFSVYNVIGGQVVSMYVDGIRTVDGVGTTLYELGDAEYVGPKELKDGTDDFYEEIDDEIIEFITNGGDALGSGTQVQEDRLEAIEPTFDYTDTDTQITFANALPSTVVTRLGDLSSQYAYQLDQMYNAFIVSGLIGSVQDKADAIGLDLANVFLATPYLFQAETVTINGDFDDAAELYVNDANDSTHLSFTVDVEVSDRDYASYSGGVLTADSDVTKDGSVDVILTLEYDNITYTYTHAVPVYTMATAQRLLNDRLVRGPWYDTGGTTLEVAYEDTKDPYLRIVDALIGDEDVDVASSNGSAGELDNQISEPEETGMLFGLDGAVIVEGYEGFDEAMQDMMTSAVIIAGGAIEASDSDISGFWYTNFEKKEYLDLYDDHDAPGANFTNAWHLLYDADSDGIVEGSGEDLASADDPSGVSGVTYEDFAQDPMLSLLTEGTYTLTLVQLYDETDGLYTKTNFTVTVVTADDAKDMALAQLAASDIRNNGEVSTGTDKLSRDTGIFGVIVDWTLDTAGNAANTGTVTNTYGAKTESVTYTRMYTDSKVVLKASVQTDLDNDGQETTTISSNSGADETELTTKLFDFRIKSVTAAEVKDRIAAEILDAIDGLPAQYDVSLAKSAYAPIIDLDNLITSTDLTEDGSSSGLSIRWTLTSVNADGDVVTATKAQTAVEAQSIKDKVDTLTDVYYPVTFLQETMKHYGKLIVADGFAKVGTDYSPIQGWMPYPGYDTDTPERDIFDDAGINLNTLYVADGVTLADPIDVTVGVVIELDMNGDSVNDVVVTDSAIITLFDSDYTEPHAVSVTSATTTTTVKLDAPLSNVADEADLSAAVTLTNASNSNAAMDTAAEYDSATETIIITTSEAIATGDNLTIDLSTYKDYASNVGSKKVVFAYTTSWAEVAPVGTIGALSATGGTGGIGVYTSIAITFNSSIKDADLYDLTAEAFVDLVISDVVYDADGAAGGEVNLNPIAAAWSGSEAAPILTITLGSFDVGAAGATVDVTFVANMVESVNGADATVTTVTVGS